MNNITEDLHCSNGPVASLPGSKHKFPAGTTCDDHPDRLAVARVQGETDSFGCEYHCLCQECYDEVVKYADSDESKSGTCDWCKTHQTTLAFHRDMDEGQGGPVYRVCSGCRTKESEALYEEINRTGSTVFDDFDDVF